MHQLPTRDGFVSVIVCTRDRPTSVARCVRSVLHSEYPNFELLVVDESGDSATHEALMPFLKNSSPISLLPLAAKGKATALNHALAHARGEYLVLTDDDCEMSPTCLSALVHPLKENSEIGAIFGDVVAATIDPEREHIPQWRIDVAKTICRPPEFLVVPTQRQVFWRNFGIGANMALRKRAVEQLGGWDQCIGPGAKFGSGDDHDLAFRLLRAGHAIHFCPQARVVHHGARPRALMNREYSRVGRGFGAACARYLRCGVIYSGSLRALRFHLLGFGLQRLQFRWLQTESAPFIRGWLAGFARGLTQPLDKATFCFEEARQTRAAVSVVATP